MPKLCKIPRRWSYGALLNIPLWFCMALVCVVSGRMVAAEAGNVSCHLWRIGRQSFCRRFIGLLVISFGMMNGVETPCAESGLLGCSEPFRPAFHFTPEKNWMNDPNGMVFYKGEYHLFYQFNPFGDQWGQVGWAHAVSTDLIHWKHLPLALAAADGVMIFSGSVVVDWKNSSGFGDYVDVPIVAIYTGCRTSDGRQFQCLAYSNDRGRTWTKYAGNPVIDIGANDFRDPKVQWYEPTRQWIMTVALPVEHKVRFYGSENLKQWKLLSEFGPANATNGVWECPDLFELSIEGTKQKRWVLTVNMNSGSVAGGSGGQYFVGRFDGKRFVPDLESLTGFSNTPTQSKEQKTLWSDYGPDFYAAVSWNDMPRSDDRRIWLGWMSDWLYADKVPTSLWRGVMTIPRKLGLRKTPAGIQLTQNPVREMEQLRERHYHFSGGTVTQANDWLLRERIGGNRLELMVDLKPSLASLTELKLFKGSNEETIVGIDPVHSLIFMDRSRSGKTDFHSKVSRTI